MKDWKAVNPVQMGRSERIEASVMIVKDRVTGILVQMGRSERIVESVIIV